MESPGNGCLTERRERNGGKGMGGKEKGEEGREFPYICFTY